MTLTSFLYFNCIKFKSYERSYTEKSHFWFSSSHYSVSSLEAIFGVQFLVTFLELFYAVTTMLLYRLKKIHEWYSVFQFCFISFNASLASIAYQYLVVLQSPLYLFNLFLYWWVFWLLTLSYYNSNRKNPIMNILVCTLLFASSPLG